MRLAGFVIHGNHRGTLQACVETLRAVCDEVVAVDSFSSDGSAALVHSLGVRSVLFPWQGCGAARAQAMTLLQPADYVFFLDADEECDADTRSRISAWKQSAPTLPYYTLQRRDWAELPTGKFLFRRETRKRLVRWDHARWRPDMILHDALPSAASVPLPDAYIEHHFAQSISGITEKQELYSLLYAVRLFVAGKKAKGSIGRRTAHVLRDAVVKGAAWRGGLEGWRLAWAVSKTHARKYELMRELQQGAYPELVAMFRDGRFEELFRAGAARLG